MICLAILSIQLVLQGELDVDAETRSKCFEHSFSVNKLSPYLSAFIPA